MSKDRTDEFPAGYFEPPPGLSRREFWGLAGASFALAGFTGCTRQPDEKIVPYVEQAEQMIPGKPLYFATAMPQPGGAIGLLVESHLGRPTKVEGNPLHPASLGATDAFAQASILGLYDPDRSQVILRNGRISSRIAFLEHFNAMLESQRALGGAGFRILTESVLSPTLAAQLRAVLKAMPQARWHQYEPAGGDQARSGARLAFGEVVHTYYRLDRAARILSLDADFLSSGPGWVRYARDFAARRRGEPMNRLYVVESTPTSTGAMADHRLALRAADVETFARAVAAAAGIAVEAPAAPELERWAAAVARDLQKHRGASVVIPGEAQPPVVHALAHAMNHALGNTGRTVIHTAPLEEEAASLAALVDDIHNGRVQALVIFGGNPAYTAPADLDFPGALQRVSFRAHLSLYQDETSALCQWHLPEAHYLEAWSDTRAYDGTVSIQQPLIAPLYGGRSAHEILAIVLGEPDATGYEMVRRHWAGQNPKQDFERWWRRTLHDGLLEGSALPPRAVTPSPKFPPPAAAARALEISFRPDPSIHDGRYANNGWLQELPKAVTKITWDNAVLMSPATARRLELKNEDEVELDYRGRKVRGPVWIVPGQPDESVTVHLGYGRTRAGRTGSGCGFNAYALRASETPWFGAGLAVRPTGGRRGLAVTQEHHTLDDRRPARWGTLEQYRQEPEFARHMEHEPPRGLTLYPEYRYDGYSWGMAVDLGACHGCNACVTACQSENNIPVVGKDQVARGREMHWIRIDRYWHGPPENPETVFQPMMCVHCENAPCEVVCPVGATVHSKEGLNEMVYNRCVGTRYCSNNCPYKVRRFNFLLYADFETPSLKLMRNPDVTVRSRGVMEKCTYCVQRINHARIEAKKEGRLIRDGEVLTACQQACPTQAIVFGNLNDPTSAVSKLKASARNYHVLADLNTRPRTSYLARVRNPNPELAS
jgi:molybdopterin-containing oxidoreductase family iron-sulfur binding subunit